MVDTNVIFKAFYIFLGMAGCAAVVYAWEFLYMMGIYSYLGLTYSFLSLVTVATLFIYPIAGKLWAVPIFTSAILGFIYVGENIFR